MAISTMPYVWRHTATLKNIFLLLKSTRLMMPLSYEYYTHVCRFCTLCKYHHKSIGEGGVADLSLTNQDLHQLVTKLTTEAEVDHLIMKWAQGHPNICFLITEVCVNW